MTATAAPFEVRLEAVRYETADVRLLEFARPDGGALPPSRAGAHIDLHLPGGLVRPYSLLATGEALHAWEVAVKRVADGRGGSAAAHDRLRVGDLLRVSPPRQAFGLAAGAARSVLIGGGIGVTPLLAMADELARAGAAFDFHVAHRSRAAAALVRRLPPHARLHLRDEADRRLDVAAIVAAAEPGTHLYCCGPAGMMTEFEQATAGWPAEQVHLERFAPAVATDPAASDGFQVQLCRTGCTVAVAPGETILHALRRAGLRPAASCEQGICGACEVGVLAGTPDHRDAVLSDAERAANTSMMLCCSRSLSPTIQLDL